MDDFAQLRAPGLNLIDFDASALYYLWVGMHAPVCLAPAWNLAIAETHVPVGQNVHVIGASEMDAPDTIAGVADTIPNN